MDLSRTARIVTATAASVIGAAIAAGQAGFPPHFREVSEAVQRGVENAFRPTGEPVNYAAASVEIERLHHEYADDPERFGVFAQIAPPWMAATGHLALAQETWDAQGHQRQAPAAPAGLEAVDALDAIVEASRGRRIVMLNEAHHVPMHRAFGRRIVQALAAEGFTHLAVEALANEADADFVNDSIARGRPTADGGFYIREPMFGELLRAAFDAGMTLIPYETTDRAPKPTPAESINAREIAQARAIGAVLEADPDARVLIFCGYSHLTESPSMMGDAELRWLACRLRDALGIDPLTISQTEYSPTSSREHDSAAYGDLLERFAPEDVIALRGADGALWSPTPDAFDIAVVHPRLQDAEGRPGYMLSGGERVLATIPNARPDGVERMFVQAIPAGEDPADAVPADQRWVEPGADATLALRPGAYLIRIYDADAVLVREEQVVINGR
jgi:hypothetical protein